MIPEIGQFCLIIALLMAVLQIFMPILGLRSGHLVWIRLAFQASYLQLFFMVMAFCLLAYCFLSNDFSVRYVALNSNSLLPAVYRFSALWGAHEGSLLLWVLILSLWTALIVYFRHLLPLEFFARISVVMAAISIGFLIFLLYASNPFTRLFPVPLDGRDLNPLLQDPGLIIHPPMLYIGYVGTAVAFSFAIAALWQGALETKWVRWLRTWVNLSWAFLTLGIALGSWWAYYELGWGGWWFWDPVENASFMPWLLATALIHSLIATERRDVFKDWSLLLAILVFALSLLGAFLVRSGILTSVHAFATDPTRGLFLLILFSIYIGSGLLIYAWRGLRFRSGQKFTLCSRETFILCNTILLLVATLTILLGTLYPLILELFDLGKISVGAPYFNQVFVPLMLPLFIILGLGVVSHWRQDSSKALFKKLGLVCLICVITSLLVSWIYYDAHRLKTAIGVFIALWIILSSLSTLKVGRLSSKAYGMLLAHIGLALCVFGVTVTSQHSQEVYLSMQTGERVQLAGYDFVFSEINKRSGPNYTADEAKIEVLRDQDIVTTLYPQKRHYFVSDVLMTEAALHPRLSRDLYVSLGKSLDDNAWAIRLYYRPFVRLLWLGALLMALGGILSIRRANHAYNAYNG